MIYLYPGVVVNLKDGDEFRELAKEYKIPDDVIEKYIGKKNVIIYNARPGAIQLSTSLYVWPPEIVEGVVEDVYSPPIRPDRIKDRTRNINISHCGVELHGVYNLDELRTISIALEKYNNMKPEDKVEFPVPPEPPKTRVLREGVTVFCKKCGSSLERDKYKWWHLLRTKCPNGCEQ